MTNYFYNINGKTYKTRKAMPAEIKAEIFRAYFAGESIMRTIQNGKDIRNEEYVDGLWVEMN